MTTFVFPGQGSQFIGMSKDFYDNFKIARETFEEIEDYVKIDLKKIIFEDANNLINLTNYTQICIFVASVSIFKAYFYQKKIDKKSINFMLGHSLGEYTALACSEKLSLKDSSLLLKYRGDLMSQAVKPNLSGMSALLGLSATKIEKIINDNNLKLEIANDNSPLQVVVSGELKEIIESEEIFLKNGVKRYVRLNVSAAFHSKYMLGAQNKLNEHIDNISFNENDIQIISNYSAINSNTTKNIIDSLKNQMSNKVRWTESILKLAELGETNIVEIGPGNVLSGLIKRISSDFNIETVSKISDMNK